MSQPGWERESGNGKLLPSFCKVTAYYCSPFKTISTSVSPVISDAELINTNWFGLEYSCLSRMSLSLSLPSPCPGNWKLEEKCNTWHILP
jgi:hypothetical protein